MKARVVTFGTYCTVQSYSKRLSILPVLHLENREKLYRGKIRRTVPVQQTKILSLQKFIFWYPLRIKSRFPSYMSDSKYSRAFRNWESKTQLASSRVSAKINTVSPSSPCECFLFFFEKEIYKMSRRGSWPQAPESWANDVPERNEVTTFHSPPLRRQPHFRDVASFLAPSLFTFTALFDMQNKSLFNESSLKPILHWL